MERFFEVKLFIQGYISHYSMSFPFTGISTCTTPKDHQVNVTFDKLLLFYSCHNLFLLLRFMCNSKMFYDNTFKTK